MKYALFLCTFLLSGLICTGLLIFSPTASAHETGIFQINENAAEYLFIAGFRDESLFIGEPTIFTFLARFSPKKISRDLKNTKSSDIQVINTFHERIEVEISAGGEKKVFPIAGLIPQAGLTSYDVFFIPTSAGPYSFRIFGTAENTPIDITFRCISSTHENIMAANPDLESHELLSKQGEPTVARKFKSGGFPCPVDRKTVEVPPSDAPSLAELQEKIDSLNARAADLSKSGSAIKKLNRALYFGYGGVGVFILILIAVKLIKKYRRPRDSFY